MTDDSLNDRTFVSSVVDCCLDLERRLLAQVGRDCCDGFSWDKYENYSSRHNGGFDFSNLRMRVAVNLSLSIDRNYRISTRRA
jgi:hypothetical protein